MNKHSIFLFCFLVFINLTNVYAQSKKIPNCRIVFGNKRLYGCNSDNCVWVSDYGLERIKNIYTKGECSCSRLRINEMNFFGKIVRDIYMTCSNTQCESTLRNEIMNINTGKNGIKDIADTYQDQAICGWD
jgi:hypothetical protein